VQRNILIAKVEERTAVDFVTSSTHVAVKTWQGIDDCAPRRVTVLSAEFLKRLRLVFGVYLMSSSMNLISVANNQIKTCYDGI
jgi:hypothetical protein